MEPDHAAWAQAREQFLGVVDEIRPQLHRYCARLTGSLIQGEDIVQEALARAFYAIAMQPELPPLRPWLFRIAHNAAIDHLRSHGQRYTEPRATLDDDIGYDDRPDPACMRAALTRFLALTIAERSAVILKDVLGHPVEEAAETMGVTVAAVKAALVRGRAKLRDAEPREVAIDDGGRELLDAYVRLFNARDWDGVRALIGEDCRLDLVSKSQRRGKAVGMYFGRYAQEPVRLEVVELDGRLALAAYVEAATRPSYYILLAHDGDRVQAIRDFRYVRYIADEAELG